MVTRCLRRPQIFLARLCRHQPCVQVAWSSFQSCTSTLMEFRRATKWLSQFLLCRTWHPLMLAHHRLAAMVCIADKPVLRPISCRFWFLVALSCDNVEVGIIGWFGVSVTAVVTYEVKLRRARLVLGLVTTFGGSVIQVFIQATQPGHPSVGRCNEYRRWFLPSLGENGAFEVTTLWRFINQFIIIYNII